MDNIKQNETSTKTGKLTIVTPPTMVKPNAGDVGFILMNLTEEQKQEFTKSLDEYFPTQEIVVFVWDEADRGDKWLDEAKINVDYIIRENEGMKQQLALMSAHHEFKLTTENKG